MEVPVKVAPEETDAVAAPADAAPKQPAVPVMDVRPPDAQPLADPPKPTPPVSEPPKPTAPAKQPDKPAESKPAPAVVPKKPRQSGAGAAIFGTVIIVLGLAALAVYAYLKTN